MTELKLCPFCGGEAELIREKNKHANGKSGSVIRCKACGAKSAWQQLSHSYSCDDEAIKWWNFRYDVGGEQKCLQ